MITITTNPQGTYINSTQVPDSLAASIVKHGKLVKVISETKVIIRPDLNTPGIWKLPWEILKRLYIIIPIVFLFSCSRPVKTEQISYDILVQDTFNLGAVYSIYKDSTGEVTIMDSTELKRVMKK